MYGFTGYPHVTDTKGRCQLMTLTDYLRVVRKRWRLIVASLVVCVLASSAFVLTSTKKYEATAQIFVSTSGADDTTTDSLAQGNTFVQARVQSYTSVAKSPSVTEQGHHASSA